MLNVNEPHFTIKNDRTILIPAELKTIAVQYDHNIETVTFDCPRYWDGNDLSAMRIQINYKLSDGYIGMYPCTDVTIDTSDNNTIHFTWTISNIVTNVSGAITFLVCALTLNPDGTASQAWHTRPCGELSVIAGMDCMGIEDAEPNQKFFDTKEDISNRVNTINSDSTETEYPSAKAVYNYAVAKSDALSEIDFSAKDNQFYNAKAINDTLMVLAEMITGLEERMSTIENNPPSSATQTWFKGNLDIQPSATIERIEQGSETL